MIYQREGKGSILEWDKDRGRVWKIVAKRGLWDEEGEKRVQETAQNEKTVNDKWKEQALESEGIWGGCCVTFICVSVCVLGNVGAGTYQPGSGGGGGLHGYVCVS